MLSRACLASALEVAGDLTVSVLSHAGYIKCVAHGDSVAPGGTRLGSRWSDNSFFRSDGESRAQQNEHNNRSQLSLNYSFMVSLLRLPSGFFHAPGLSGRDF